MQGRGAGRRSRRLILIELNEINFDVVRRYVAESPGALPAFEAILRGNLLHTSSESRYELLEPWIQWPSVHTGLTQSEHGVFRLGDIVGTKAPQLFEVLEAGGVKVGAISPMNAENRLKLPAYFIPDPWTNTPTDGSWWSRNLGAAVAQAVNDNSQARITPRSAIILLLGLVRFSRFRNFGRYLALAAGSVGSPWKKALFLDLFLHDLHLALFQSKCPGFSVLFLNAGAHIQHHYFFNCGPLRGGLPMGNPEWYVRPGADPVKDMLRVYDLVLGECMSLRGVELVVATGLSQKPYDRAKHYYRLRHHAEFLRRVGVVFEEVSPRMTRDFLVEFRDAEAALAAQHKLAEITVGPKDLPLFGEIDNRGNSLFVTLTFPDEITAQTEARSGTLAFPLQPHVVFVAIKNGMHQETGFAFLSEGLRRWAPDSGAHVKSLNSTICGYFGGAAVDPGATSGR